MSAPIRRSSRQRASKSVWDPADESARPQRKLELTLQVLRRQVRELATRSGSRWAQMTPKEARKAIAVHMRVPLEDLDRRREEITFLIREYQSTAAGVYGSGKDGGGTRGQAARGAN